VVASWNNIAFETLNCLAFMILAVPASTTAARLIGRKDPGQIVCDEISGQLISLFLLPLNWAVALLAFLLFRTFDIIKPYPADKLEQLPNGWGIVGDDVMAGIYANLVLRVLLYLNWLPMALY
jgi:phosphatidylglycerophosphatase A